MEIKSTSAVILEPTAIASSTIKSKEIILSNEYEKSNTCNDLKNLLTQLGFYSVKVCKISLLDYHSVCEELYHQLTESNEQLVVFNLCDGCETDGYPGISVLDLLQEYNIPFTGSSASFYRITTSKPVLKKYLIDNNVSTSPFIEISASTSKEQIDALGYPLIVKPSISYASISISYSSVVFNANEALEQARKVIGAGEGVFVEKFLDGREFTAFVTGSKEEGVFVHQVAERVFDPKLSNYQRILAFDKYWEGYDIDGSKPEKETMLYKYEQAPQELQNQLKQLARDAYLAVEGSGYGRVDMREHGDVLYVLEVNANCGISFNPTEFTSTVGEILRMSGESVSKFAIDMGDFALRRAKRLSK